MSAFLSKRSRGIDPHLELTSGIYPHLEILGLFLGCGGKLSILLQL